MKRNNRLTVSGILALLSGSLPAFGQSIEIVTETFDGTIGSAFGYKVQNPPQLNQEVTVDFTMEGLLDWWIPAGSGQGDQLAPPFYGMVGSEVISLVELQANMSGNWLDSAGQPYIRFADGEQAALPGVGLPSPEPSGWFGFSWYGNPNGELENTLVLRAEVGAKSVSMVSWMGNGSVTGTGQMNYTATLYNAAGDVLASDTVEFQKTDPLRLTLYANATGTSEGDYLEFAADFTNMFWMGTFVQEMNEGSTDWYGFSVDEVGWANTESWLGWVNVTHEPWVISASLDRYIYLPDDSGWVYIPKVVADSASGWYGFATNELGWANTAPWLNWVNISADPYVWVQDLGKYIYIPDDSGWVYVSQ